MELDRQLPHSSGDPTSPGIEAARALALIKDPCVIDLLIAAIKDNDWNVRGNAALALGFLLETHVQVDTDCFPLKINFHMSE